MTIIITKNGKEAKRISKTSFAYEDNLQNFIHENPDSVPLYDIDEDIRLLILAREVPTISGPIDAIGTDERGEVYIIETKLYKNPDKPKGKSVKVTISVSSFVPKPFTPFQWEAQDTEQSFLRKQELLRECIRTKKVSVNVHNTGMSLMEAVLARGDRRLSSVLEEAYKAGCIFDSWDDHFNLQKWFNAFVKVGLTPEFYANRKRNLNETFPWDHLDFGIDKDFLIREYKASQKGRTTPNCRTKCSRCGANNLPGGQSDACC